MGQVGERRLGAHSFAFSAARNPVVAASAPTIAAVIFSLHGRAGSEEHFHYCPRRKRKAVLARTSPGGEAGGEARCRHRRRAAHSLIVRRLGATGGASAACNR